MTYRPGAPWLASVDCGSPWEAKAAEATLPLTRSPSAAQAEATLAPPAGEPPDSMDDVLEVLMKNGGELSSV